jgi:ABC-2 type transport system permease protein
VFLNIVFGLLLVFTGANVPLDVLPGWMSAISRVLPFTHGIEAARELADGASLGDVRGLVAAELGLGGLYAAAGFAFLLAVERQSRRHATLDRA